MERAADTNAAAAQHGISEIDQARALEALAWNWGDAYDIGCDDGEWWFRRKDGKGGRETAGSADELYKRIVDDYAFMPVPRDLP